MSLLSILFLCFQIMDGITTFVALNFFDCFREGNPLLLHLGWPGLIALKVIIVVGSVWIVEHYKAYPAMILPLILTALIVVNNAVRLVLEILT